MYKHPVLKNQCKFCGWISTKEKPVKYGVCSVCRELKKDYPKKIRCFLCGHEEIITFEEWSRRGNCCRKCDAKLTERVKVYGYPILPKNRYKMKEWLNV